MIGNMNEKEFVVWSAAYAAHFNWQSCRRYENGAGWATDEFRDREEIAEDAENAEVIADAAVYGFRRITRDS